ncbi:hypothetical protein B0H10DRAFT_2007061 [Mycena sp. CBHHK59/15]|nr:hypothetical protein B0H10DRAFT_2007061 [Mycena sp. CBHHK59/15]
MCKFLGGSCFCLILRCDLGASSSCCRTASTSHTSEFSPCFLAGLMISMLLRPNNACWLQAKDPGTFPAITSTIELYNCIPQPRIR